MSKSYEKASSTPMDQECFLKEGPLKRFVEPRLLYLIKQKSAYGYEMIEQIGDLPFPGPPPDSAAVYRLLRDLERRGLVKSEWQTGEAGPSKRIYHITSQGEARLEMWVAALKERVRILNRFVSMCEKPG